MKAKAERSRAAGQPPTTRIHSRRRTDAVVLEAGVEAEVGDEDGHPGEHTGDGRQRREPVEDGRRPVRDIEVGERAEQGRRDEAEHGQAALGGVAEERGRLAVHGETVERARRGVEVRVAGRVGRDEDDRIDDGWEGFDAGSLDADDKRRTGGVAGVADQVRVVVGDEPADDEDAADVEEEDAVEDASDGLGHGAARVGRLAGGQGDDLGPEERKGGCERVSGPACADGRGRRTLDEGGPEGEEASLRSADAVELVERAGVLPEDEAEARIGVRAAAEPEDEPEDDEADDSDDLDGREPELGFAVPSDAEEVDGADGDEELPGSAVSMAYGSIGRQTHDGDVDGDRGVLVPLLAQGSEPSPVS